MRILVAEDDFPSRMFLSNIASEYGRCDLASQGIEAVTAFQSAYEEGDPYNIYFWI